MGLHVSRDARERYRFEEGLFALSGRAVLDDSAAARRFAQALNQRPNTAAAPGTTVRAGDVGAMSLLDDILDYVIELYREQRNPAAISASMAALEKRLGREVVDATLATFVEHFPSLAAARGELAPADYLSGQTDGRANREVALQEAMLLWLANMNPAYAPLGELIDDRPLEEGSAYEAAIRGLHLFFARQPGFGPEDDDLISLLRKPALESSSSLSGQLQWIAQNWPMVRKRFGDRLLRSLDMLTEEERAAWMRFHATHGGGDGDADTSALHGFSDLESEEERFSLDRDWMPRLVLMAKSTYVWLDQLARQHGQPIWRLDQVPDEELDRLAGAGFSGLWLIGLWERSPASQRIKQMRGNPEAVASAYSLMDYRISEDLGGEEAYVNLRDRAWARGIRLASDMVPNHMGIDSRWVIEHADWFMWRPEPPYPAYSYDGPNLSSDERVGIYLEDHYFDNTDAAVTFKREDRWSGEARYIYHGNDGTSMPWNDTAQLDYLKPEVREAVIQTILHVCRLFPVIRFDAAMTLAKKHIARLWYPEPGSGGAIPSRAEYSMSKRDFDRAMPIEFWREVVDRVAAEAPDTLLLAEAFWLMEGYFVRTLGMHRVYNSAFMNMLRDEKNAEYRLVIKNTLGFDPQILKRYVNFMNNPDERTAIDQFGDGDKYFGVCTLMVTMPGLPMFGHGQLEGFTEKYGMEFRRAGLAEEPKAWLIERHEREIFPLLHRRELFAEVENFHLYDFVTADGSVNEDVFAYSNRRGGERTLVVYNNRYESTAGWIRTAAITGQPLAGGLALENDERRYLVLRDQRTGLAYLRNARALHDEGLYLQLDGYRTHVFMDMYELHDTDGRYGRLADWLGGRAVPDIDEALREMQLEPLHGALRETFSAQTTEAVETALAGLSAEIGQLAARDDVLIRPGDVQPGLEEATILAWRDEKTKEPSEAQAALHQVWRLAKAIEREVEGRPGLRRGSWLDEWRLGPVVADILQRLRPGAVPGDYAEQMPDIVRVLLSGNVPAGGRTPPAGWLRDPLVARAIGANQHDGITWFNKERLQRLAEWLQVPVLEKSSKQSDRSAALERARRLIETARTAGYRLDRLETELDKRSGKPVGTGTRSSRR